MKLEIYDATKLETKLPVFLRLQGNNSGVVDVVLVNAAGKLVEGGFLLRFLTDGRVKMHQGVNPGFGFELNSMCQIRIK